MTILNKYESFYIEEAPYSFNNKPVYHVRRNLRDEFLGEIVYDTEQNRYGFQQPNLTGYAPWAGRLYISPELQDIANFIESIPEYIQRKYIEYQQLLLKPLVEFIAAHPPLVSRKVEDGPGYDPVFSKEDQLIIDQMKESIEIQLAEFRKKNGITI